jgi:DNA-directed RNA polymerase
MGGAEVAAVPEQPLFGARSGAPESDRDRELRLERDGFDAAIGRYRIAIDGATQHQLRASAMARHFAELSVAVGTEQATLCRPNARLPKYGPALLAVDAARAAVVTLHTLFAQMGVAADPRGAEANLTSVARAVGDACYRLWLQDKQVPGRRRDVAQMLAGKYRGVRAAALAKRRTAGLDRPWSRGYLDIHLGVFLIALAARATGSVEVVKRTRHTGGQPRAVNVVRLTDAARAEVAADLNRAEGRILPVRRPMVCPPIPWVDLQGGGYLTDADLDCGLPLVTHHDRPARVAALQKAVRSGQLDRVLRVVNALQATSWRVNTELRGWMARCVERAADDDHPMWSAAAARLAECADLATEPRLFFPYKLDYRGRAYCVPESFQPQGDDAARALLEFAVGKPLGDRGAFWLAVHLADLNGGPASRGTLDERTAWTSANETDILAAAADPIGFPFWRSAKKPWAFLRACLEWAAYRRDGVGHVSHLPVSVDGTCNGFQHLAALARDERTGRDVNLLASDRPQDIYQRVADAVVGHMRADADADGRSGPNAQRLARDYLDRGGPAAITRDVVKGPTMTAPYGSKVKGLALAIQEDAVAGLSDWPHAWYLATTIRACVESLGERPAEVMRWLKGVTGVLADAGLGVRWVAPSGFPVVMEERVRRRVRVVLGTGRGKRRELMVDHYDPAARIDKAAQRRRVVPNYVHSMDAAHLVLTIDALLDRGLEHFHVVHDGFGVHAADVDQLNAALRQAFAAMYTASLLERFADDERVRADGQRTDVDWRKIGPPPCGDLDVAAVLDSVYFFS